MNIQQLLAHHGIAVNPFAEEDAQTDPVFKEHCITSMRHPAWDKVYGNPADPSTSVVFGEKGSGKTALRLQIVRHVADYNRSHPNQRLFVIEYDDFNPFLDRFRDKLSGRKRGADKVLSQWKLWDHMDAIMSLGVTQLVDRILEDRPRSTVRPLDIGPLETQLLDRRQKRDLLLLAAFYDQTSSETFRQRWHRLRRKLRFRTWKTKWPVAVIGLAAVIVGVVTYLVSDWEKWLSSPWPYVILAASSIPWALKAAKWLWTSRGIARQLRVVDHRANPLRRVLQNFSAEELSGQPLPDKERTDDRFELLAKLQGVLGTLGFGGIMVLVDRVDEPHLINGSPEQMRTLLWPMFDNKFLKHPGIGFKLLLPIELSYFIDREDREFYQRARLDKQNLIPSLEWTGAALYDVANSRLKACAANGKSPTLRDLFDESVTDQRLMESLRSLRVPRHLFKFLYRTFIAHCNAHTDDNPVWKISAQTYESSLALYQRDQDAFDRGMGAG